MKVVFASSEVYPFSKTGGLADVAGALPAALSRLGHELLVISPWYRDLNADPHWIGDIAVPFDGRFEPAGIGTLERDGVRFAFIGNPLFSREQLYGYQDDVRRFALFSRALPQAAARLGFQPDLFHLNDWHTALTALVLTDGWHLPAGFSGLKSLLSVHNVQFQGEAELDETIWWLRLPREARDTWLNRLGRANALQGGIGSAALVNTVSPTYAREVQDAAWGHGLHTGFRTLAAAGRFSGVLNGLDTDVWNPAADRALPRPYDAATVTAGKAAARAELTQRYSLPADRPLLTAVSRLSDQKGIDVLLDAVPGLLQLGFSVMVLGSGDPGLELQLEQAAAQESRLAFHRGFNESLAHLIYAAADLLVMPSRFEPCGLNQLIAMRYGTLPLVRATGGLIDTVDHLQTGFLFDHAAAWSLLGSAELAASLYGTERFREMQQAAMAKDFSWDRSARRYSNLYSGILDQ